MVGSRGRTRGRGLATFSQLVLPFCSSVRTLALPTPSSLLPFFFFRPPTSTPMASLGFRVPPTLKPLALASLAPWLPFALRALALPPVVHSPVPFWCAYGLSGCFCAGLLSRGASRSSSRSSPRLRFPSNSFCCSDTFVLFCDSSSPSYPFLLLKVSGP